jgi:hypothetical protein
MNLRFPRQLPFALMSGLLLVSMLHAQTEIVPVSPNIPVNRDRLPDGLVMMGGKVYEVRGGVATPLDHDLVMTISPTTITGFDQVPRKLAPDQMLTMDGRIVQMPSGIVLAPPPPPPLTPEQARNLPRSVSGENVSGLAPTPPPQSRTVIAPRPAPRPPTTVTTTVSTTIPANPAKPPVVQEKTTVFDPKQVNDGSIEAAGTGTRRRSNQ